MARRDQRALTNERWPWLPQKGLEPCAARGSSGRWKSSEEGYIEKGRFRNRTRVLVAERDYKEDTGTAVSKFSRKMRQSRRVHYAPNCRYSGQPTIRDTIFETNETVLWFLAIDPDAAHETGDPLRWKTNSPDS